MNRKCTAPTLRNLGYTVIFENDTFIDFISIFMILQDFDAFLQISGSIFFKQRTYKNS